MVCDPLLKNNTSELYANRYVGAETYAKLGCLGIPMPEVYANLGYPGMTGEG